MNCPVCGAAAFEGDRHCTQCGAELGQKLKPEARLVLSSLKDQLKGMRESLHTISFKPPIDMFPPARLQALAEALPGEAVDTLDYRIIMVEGRRAGEIFDVGRIITFGRAENCEVQLTDIAVSREHCRIVFHPDRRVFLLQDLGSHNGTLLNQNPVKKAELKSGDRIKVGESIAVFYREPLPDDIRADLARRNIQLAGEPTSSRPEGDKAGTADLTAAAGPDAGEGSGEDEELKRASTATLLGGGPAAAAPKQPTPSPVSVRQPSPVPRQSTPSPRQPSPVPRQPSPVPRQPSPVPRQPSPVPRQPTPSPRQASPPLPPIGEAALPGPVPAGSPKPAWDDGQDDLATVQLPAFSRSRQIIPQASGIDASLLEEMGYAETEISAPSPDEVPPRPEEMSLPRASGPAPASGAPGGEDMVLLDEPLPRAPSEQVLPRLATPPGRSSSVEPRNFAAPDLFQISGDIESLATGRSEASPVPSSLGRVPTQPVEESRPSEAERAAQPGELPGPVPAKKEKKGTKEEAKAKGEQARPAAAGSVAEGQATPMATPPAAAARVAAPQPRPVSGAPVTAPGESPTDQLAQAMTGSKAYLVLLILLALAALAGVIWYLMDQG